MTRIRSSKAVGQREQNFVIKRIAALREELEDLMDYLELLEARALNFGKSRRSTAEVRKILNLK
jgi:hypothetical protein